jgi:hypothetical protein
MAQLVRAIQQNGEAVQAQLMFPTHILVLQGRVEALCGAVVVAVLAHHLMAHLAEQVEPEVVVEYGNRVVGVLAVLMPLGQQGRQALITEAVLAEAVVVTRM